METAHRSRGHRAGRRPARLLLALTVIAGALTLAVAGARPAAAAAPVSIVRNPDVIVMESPRMTDLQTHVTVWAILRSNGDVVIQTDAHCTANTRKFVVTGFTVRSPAAGLTITADSGDLRRIDVEEWDSWSRTSVNASLAANWSTVLNDPNLSGDFQMNASRVPW